MKSLIDWGFGEEEISVFDGSFDDVIDFCGAEKTKIENLEQKTLVFLLYKGHGTVENGCVQAATTGDKDNINIEGFCRSIAKKDNVYVVAVFDCCRRDKGTTVIETELEDVKNLICIYREECSPFEPTTCTCKRIEIFNYDEKFFEHLDQ